MFVCFTYTVKIYNKTAVVKAKWLLVEGAIDKVSFRTIVKAKLKLESFNKRLNWWY